MQRLRDRLVRRCSAAVRGVAEGPAVRNERFGMIMSRTNGSYGLRRPTTKIDLLGLGGGPHRATPQRLTHPEERGGCSGRFVVARPDSRTLKAHLLPHPLNPSAARPAACDPEWICNVPGGAAEMLVNWPSLHGPTFDALGDMTRLGIALPCSRPASSPRRGSPISRHLSADGHGGGRSQRSDRSPGDVQEGRLRGRLRRDPAAGVERHQSPCDGRGRVAPAVATRQALNDSPVRYEGVCARRRAGKKEAGIRTSVPTYNLYPNSGSHPTVTRGAYAAEERCTIW